MFPILHGRRNLLTGGWYFPPHGVAVGGGLACYAVGYRANAEPVTVGLSPFYAGDTAIDLRFPVADFDLNRTAAINLRLRSPSGRVVDLAATYLDAHTVVYPLQVGDIAEPGSWRYQISLSFKSGAFYHLDSAKFRVKANIPGVN